jgi:hypothetical protein
VPRAASTLLAAAKPPKGENQLTALLAVVIEGNLDFANNLLSDAGLPTAEQVEVSREVDATSRRRVDMEVLALDAAGSVVARLWSEHKTGAAYQPEQLPDYQRALGAYPEPARLITIVPNRDAAPAGQGPWKVLTWWDVARLLWQAGAQRGPGWRRKALNDGALARERLLVELLDYLEEEEGIVFDPLTHEDLFALSRADNTTSIIEGLLERAGDLSSYKAEGGLGWYPKESVVEYWQLFSARGTWAEPLEGYPELHISGNDWWSDDRLDEPAFAAGFTLPSGTYEELRSSSRADWQAEIAGHGVSIALEYGHTRVYRTMYVAELVSRGPTLDRQARALSEWFDESIRIISVADPHLSPARPKPRTPKS